MTPVIIREHRQFLIVDKPAGWLVHPTRPDGTFTLIDWLRERYPGEFLSLVSRLDRETSGLLLVARGRENASRLGKMQQRREIQKRYLALVHGRPPAAGMIAEPLDRLGKHRTSRIYIRQAVIPGTYPAVTEFKTLETLQHPTHGLISLLEATPRTGRLHQIRAHFEHLGFPIVYDKIYGKEDDFFLNFINKVVSDDVKMPRHCLHSSKLSFFWCQDFSSGNGNCGVPEVQDFSVEIPLAEDLEAIWREAKSNPCVEGIRLSPGT